MLDKEPASKLCDDVGLKPTVLYRWPKEFFENGAAAFDQKRPMDHSADQERFAYLEQKIRTKDVHLRNPTGSNRSGVGWPDRAWNLNFRIADNPGATLPLAFSNLSV